jgi:hypothetical protein
MAAFSTCPRLAHSLAGGGVIWDVIALDAAVIPAKAGIQSFDGAFPKLAEWIPAFAGMTMALSTPVAQMTPLPARG